MSETNSVESNFLEKGDFFPFIKIGNRHMHNLVNNRHTLIFNTKQKINTSKLSSKYNILVRRENENVFNILKNNCNKICKNNEYEIIFEKAVIGISRMFEIKPSVIFIDPPYNKEDINLILLTILKKNIKSKDTVLIIEIERKDQIVIPGDFNVFKEKIYGKTKLLFLN